MNLSLFFDEGIGKSAERMCVRGCVSLKLLRIDYDFASHIGKGIVEFFQAA